MDIKKLLNNKRVLLAIGAVVVIILVIIIALMSGKKKEEAKTDTLGDKLNKFGATFYEEKYYAMLADKQKLAEFKDSGINVNVSSVEVLLPLDAETKKILNEKQCNLDETKIIIYPKAPYGAKDYNLKVELSCKKG